MTGMARSITTTPGMNCSTSSIASTLLLASLAYLPIPLLLYQPRQQQPNGGIVGDQDLSSHWVGTSNRSVFPIEQGTLDETLP
jgi:hypothetical protein